MIVFLEISFPANVNVLSVLDNMMSGYGCSSTYGYCIWPLSFRQPTSRHTKVCRAAQEASTPHHVTVTRSFLLCSVITTLITLC